MNDGNEGSARGAQNTSATNAAAKPGSYELYNVFGTPTGRRVVLAAGDRLPAAPKGWFWRQVTEA